MAEVPPSCSDFSTTTTSAPWTRAVRAVLKPAAPEPITATSHSWVSLDMSGAGYDETPADGPPGSRGDGNAAKVRGKRFGSPGRARTADLVINSHPLYQLSYRGLASRASYRQGKLPVNVALPGDLQASVLRYPLRVAETVRHARFRRTVLALDCAGEARVPTF